jgi:hypothetical protein
MKPDETGLKLELTADISWIPVLQGVVESSAPILGLDANKALRLSMACEEILLHLSACAPGVGVGITLNGKPAQMAATFVFKSDTSDLWAMNLTAANEITVDPEKGLDQMGLLLASRMVDHFSISLADGRVRIILYQDRSYPEITPVTAVPGRLKEPLSIDPQPEPAAISQGCAQVLAQYPGHLYPSVFITPGKVTDLIAGGQFTMAAAMDQAGSMAGLIAWETVSEKTIRFYGPYLFVDDPGEIPRLLIDHLVNCAARTPALILYSDMATPALPAGDFEVLASFDQNQTDTLPIKKTLWFRHLREDMGCRVWAHPSMAPFLKETYDRLFLLRTIQSFSHSGQQRPVRSLFGATLDKETKQAMLWPMLDGIDLCQNIRHHVRMLQDGGFDNIFFSLDLSQGWQAALGGDLMENGFAPVYVLPWAGHSDKVVCRYVDPAA